MALEEVGVSSQKVVDGLLGQFFFDKFGLGLGAHNSMNPSDMYSAFPVSQTGSDPPCQLTTT